LATFEAIISANTMSYAKRFSLLIRDIYGVDWWKNRGSKISCYCPFKGVGLYLFWAIFSSDIHLFFNKLKKLTVCELLTYETACE
jgi:hypothetical protein